MEKVFAGAGCGLAFVFFGLVCIIILIFPSNSGLNVPADEFELLAKVISAEARGEPYEGQVAVGAVIMNRVKNSAFPNTITEVVYQKNQFTCMYDGQIDQPVSLSCRQAAQDALNGVDPTGGCLYYYNPKTATSKWIFKLPIHYSIGNHVFSRGL